MKTLVFVLLLAVTAVSATCGNGVVEPQEACDDGNANNYDGCSLACAIEVGYRCNAHSPSVCVVCTDWVVESTTTMDTVLPSAPRSFSDAPLYSVSVPSRGLVISRLSGRDSYSFAQRNIRFTYHSPPKVEEYTLDVGSSGISITAMCSHLQNCGFVFMRDKIYLSAASSAGVRGIASFSCNPATASCTVVAITNNVSCGSSWIISTTFNDEDGYILARCYDSGAETAFPEGLVGASYVLPSHALARVDTSHYIPSTKMVVTYLSGTLNGVTGIHLQTQPWSSVTTGPPVLTTVRISPLTTVGLDVLSYTPHIHPATGNIVHAIGVYTNTGNFIVVTFPNTVGSLAGTVSQQFQYTNGFQKSLDVDDQYVYVNHANTGDAVGRVSILAPATLSVVVSMPVACNSARFPFVAYTGTRDTLCAIQNSGPITAYPFSSAGPFSSYTAVSVPVGPVEVAQVVIHNKLADKLYVIGSNSFRIATRLCIPPPVACVGSFGAFGDCSVSCGGGTSSRTYTITAPAENGGSACPHANGFVETTVCNTNPCPVDCVGSFDAACSVSCGGGTRTGTYVITTAAANNGAPCPYAAGYVGSETCNTQPCPVACVVTSTTSHGACSCNGIRTVTVHNTVVTQPLHGGLACPAICPVATTESCVPVGCQVDCVGAFGAFGTCSATCGGGTHSRTFVVTTPSAYGGAACAHANGAVDTQPCNTQACPVNCVGAFGPYGACSLTCGGGTQMRTYAVSTPAANGGAACSRSHGDQETAACNTTPCPVDCVWGAWSAFGVCSVPCGGGTQTRTRAIAIPAAHGGASCSGSDTEFQPCNTFLCAVCGNTVRQGAEECDDGNLIGADGCSNQCAIDLGWACDLSTAPNACFAFSRIDDTLGVLVVIDIVIGTCVDATVSASLASLVSALSGYPVAGIQLSAVCSHALRLLQTGPASQQVTVTALSKARAVMLALEQLSTSPALQAQYNLAVTRIVSATPLACTISCPVDCVVSDWSACSKTCGVGIQTRTVTTQPLNGGAACPALSQYCTLGACSTNGAGSGGGGGGGSGGGSGSMAFVPATNPKKLVAGNQQDLVTNPTSNAAASEAPRSTQTQTQTLSVGAQAGIGSGAAVLLIAMTVGITVFVVRRRQKGEGDLAPASRKGYAPAATTEDGLANNIELN